jgi:hypothetical protein
MRCFQHLTPDLNRRHLNCKLKYIIPRKRLTSFVRLLSHRKTERRLQMKRIARVFGLAVTVSMGSPFSALAGSVGYSPACQLGNLAGGYSFALNGSRAEGSGTDAIRFSPFASVMLVKFNGSGKFTGSGPRSSSGSVERSTIDGTYTVNADCSADLSWDTTVEGTQTDTTTAYAVIDTDGNNVHVIVLTDTLGGLTASGVLEKAGNY